MVPAVLLEGPFVLEGYVRGEHEHVHVLVDGLARFLQGVFAGQGDLHDVVFAVFQLAHVAVRPLMLAGAARQRAHGGVERGLQVGLGVALQRDHQVVLGNIVGKVIALVPEHIDVLLRAHPAVGGAHVVPLLQPDGDAHQHDGIHIPVGHHKYLFHASNSALSAAICPETSFRITTLYSLRSRSG